MNDTTGKLRGLVEAVYTRTADEQLSWEISNDKVVAEIATYKLEISEEPGESFSLDIRYTIFDWRGEQIDSFTDPILATFSPVNVRFDNYYQVMSATLELARRQASGADKAIGAMLETLGASPISDPPPVAPKGGFSDDLDDDVPF